MKKTFLITFLSSFILLTSCQKEELKSKNNEIETLNNDPVFKKLFTNYMNSSSNFENNKSIKQFHIELAHCKDIKTLKLELKK